MARPKRLELKGGEKERAKLIGKRLWDAARARPKGVLGFHAELRKLGVRGVSSPKELYPVLKGGVAASPPLLDAASRILGVHRSWLETGQGERDLPTKQPWLEGVGRTRVAHFRRELSRALSRVYEQGRAEVLAQNVADYIAGGVVWMDREPRQEIVGHLEELCRVAPHLAAADFGKISYLASVAQALIDLSDTHAELFKRITLRSLTQHRAQELSWKILWAAVIDVAQADAGIPIRRIKRQAKP